MASKKTVIVTATSYKIGAAVVRAFLDRGCNVAATSRSASKVSFARIAQARPNKFDPDLFVLESTLSTAAGMAFGLIAAYGLLWFARAPMEAHFGLWR